MLTKIVKRKIGELKYGERPKRPELIESLECGYHPEQYPTGYILIDKQNNVWDGNHRVGIMHDMYGEDYEIDVKISNRFFLYFLLIFSVPFLILKSIVTLQVIKLKIGINDKEYSFLSLLFSALYKIIFAPIKLMIAGDDFARDRIKRIKKIIRINKENPYKHHEK